MLADHEAVATATEEAATLKIFITGGSGYVGGATIEALIRHGHEVNALVRSDTAAQRVRHLGAAPIHGGLRDLDTLRASAADADGVIHLGQERGPQTAEVDLAAAEAMLEGAADAPYVHTGGTWIYGDTPGIIDEDAAPAPPGLVAWRLDNENRVLSRAAEGAHPVVVMPGIVYGRSAGLIEQFFVQPARARGAVHYIAPGTNHWAMVHVDDIAELYVLALHAPPGGTYAGVSDEYPTVESLTGALSRAAGCPGATRGVTLEEARAEMGPIADAFALDQRISNARARTQLGWAPKHTTTPPARCWAAEGWTAHPDPGPIF